MEPPIRSYSTLSPAQQRIARRAARLRRKLSDKALAIKFGVTDKAVTSYLARARGKGDL